jgi:NAD+ diphosphatase
MLSFTGNPLNRASDKRCDAAWLSAQLAVGRVLPFWQMKPLVLETPAGTRSRVQAAFLPWRESWQGRTVIFLGLDGEEPLFAVDLGKDEPAPDFSLEAGRGEFRDMRAAAFVLAKRDTAIAGQAKALLDWHARHGFCPNCGAATEVTDGGYRRLCGACHAEHFPRTDPVVIMLPVNGDACLVGRNQRFQNGLFSAFAGFVEPGETLEEAVKRELLEEVSLKVEGVRYSRSQPWPFPSSLMLGCYARALSRDFAIDGSEIAEARWVTKNEARRWLKEEMLDEMRVPAAIAIAHHLIRDWVEERRAEGA